MAKKHVINQDSNTSFQIKQDGSTWIVKEGVTVDVAGGYALDNALGADNVEYIIEGALGGDNSSMWRGMNEWGKNTRIEVTETGLITGGTGVMAMGDNLKVFNDGVITGDSTALDIDGRNYFIRNSGLITASDINDKAILINSSFANGKIINEQDGIIDGVVEAVSGGAVTFINKGTIADVPTAAIDVYLSANDDHFVNRGTLNGTAFLGAGNDVADLRNGTATGIVSGSQGNDTYIVNKDDGQAFEYADQGIDTLKTSVNFDARMGNGEIENFKAIGKTGITIIANEYDNMITGNRGKNFLDGQAGDDTLRGGKSADIFNFGTGKDSDRIMDFEDGKDVINVASWNNIGDFSDIQAIMSVSGDDLVLAFGNDDLTLRNTKISELDASDFIF